MLDLYLLRYFLAVVETGSFTRAADKSFVTQPTLSAGIKKLEEQVGQALFERTNRRVFLTDAGTRFLPRAKAIMHECNLALQQIEQDEEKPVLRLGVLSTLSTEWVSILIAGFRVAEPSVVLEIMDGTEQELLNRLDDRSLDYALSLYRGEKEAVATPLHEEGYKFIVSNDHATARNNQTTANADDLSETRMIVRSRCEVLSATSRYFTDRNVRPRLVYRTMNDQKAVAMVLAGVGGTIVPDSMVPEGAHSLHLEGFDYKRRLALFNPHYDMPDHTRAMGDSLRSYVVSKSRINM